MGQIVLSWLLQDDGTGPADEGCAERTNVHQIGLKGVVCLHR